ncbi:MAG: YchJ family protein [Cyanobacteria bacterium P01_F01_bin.143]
MNLCPCNSRKKYQYCCGVYLSGKELPETAEQLMRSRYTAFCQGDVDYLIATHHPDQRAKDERKQLQNTIKKTSWLGLNVIDASRGQKHSKVAFVEFMAVFQTDKIHQLHERSKFLKIDGKWFYTEGEILPDIIPKKNENCWCGSGKKYKKCHGK